MTPYHPLTHSFLIKPLAVSLANPLLGFAMLGAFSKANAKAFSKAHAFSKADASGLAPPFLAQLFFQS